MSAKTMDILEQLKSLNLLETSELIKQIEATFDVDASVPQIVPIAYRERQIEKEDEPEKTEFDVILEEVPSEKKIAVLKLVRSLTGLGLKEAKDLVEATPQVLKSAIALPDAEDIKQQLESVGAKVSLK